MSRKYLRTREEYLAALQDKMRHERDAVLEDLRQCHAKLKLDENEPMSLAQYETHNRKNAKRLYKLLGGFSAACARAGLPFKQRKPISGRSNVKVVEELAFMPLVRPEEKKARTCLVCDQLFISDWAGHRTCDQCTRCRDYHINAIAPGFEECA